MIDLEPRQCPLCDAHAQGALWDKKHEMVCAGCGHFYITLDASRELDDLSGAGRAVVAENMRRRLHAHRRQNPEVVPTVGAEDVRNAAARRG